MNQKTSSKVSNEEKFTVLGAVLALIFVKAGSPGLIGVGAVLGMSIGSGLSRRYEKNA